MSRDFIASNDDVTTVVCAPISREALGLRSEALLGREDDLPHDSSIRCDFLTLMFKRKLTRFVSSLSNSKVDELNRALGYALALD